MRPFFCLFPVSLSVVGFSRNKPPLKLWYNQPAEKTGENALPIGNGRLGVMVNGNVARRTIQLNEHTAWSGSPNRNDNPDALAALPQIRQLIFANKQKAAERLANKAIISRKSHGQLCQPVGSLHLAFEGHAMDTDYYRELGMEQAVAKTTYTVDGVTYTRDALASFADRVVVVQLTSSKPGRLFFTASFSTPQRAVITTTSPRELTLAGSTSDHEGVKGMVKFNRFARIKTQGGQHSANDSTLTGKGANTATIYVSIATNFNRYKDLGGDEQARARAFPDIAYPKSYAAILASHIRAYQRYSNRVKLDLGTTSAARLFTDERLKNFRNTGDPALVTLYYQYGCYLLIASSQPGHDGVAGQPANLQGIWSHPMKPPWNSKYTININAQMNYWPAEKTASPSCTSHS